MSYPKKHKSQSFKEAVSAPMVIAFCQPDTPECKEIDVRWSDDDDTYMLYVVPAYMGVKDFVITKTNRSGTIDFEN